jgi:hypothetical protein
VAYRQFDAIIADLNYQLPSQNAFDRKIDQDTPWRSNQDLGEHLAGHWRRALRQRRL